MKMVSNAQKMASAKYDKKNVIGKYVKLNKVTDHDIIMHIEKKNFQGYVKDLIRKDMNSHE